MMAKKKINPWIKHLNEFRKKHPKMNLSEAMKKARKTYRKK